MKTVHAIEDEKSAPSSLHRSNCKTFNSSPYRINIPTHGKSVITFFASSLFLLSSRFGYMATIASTLNNGFRRKYWSCSGEQAECIDHNVSFNWLNRINNNSNAARILFLKYLLIIHLVKHLPIVCWYLHLITNIQNRGENGTIPQLIPFYA